MKIITNFLLLFVFFASCKTDVKKVQLEKIEVNLKESPQIELDSIIENIVLVPLETNENCLINHIDKIKLYKNKVFILDRKSACIFVFKKTGEFVFKISSQGRGSGEYIMIADFDISPETGDIYILDAMSDRLLIFKNEKYIKRYKLDFGVKITNMCFLDEKNIAFENQISTEIDSLKYYLFVTDLNLELISKNIHYNKSNALILSPVSPFSPFDDKISYLPVYKDTIYHINSNKVIPVYKLEFGNNWIDEDYLYNKKINPNTLFNDLKKSSSVYFINCIESRTHIFVYFTHKDEKYAFLYDKIFQKGLFIKNYMKNGCGYNGLPLIPDGEKFVGIVNPYELSNINKEKIFQLFPHLDDVEIGHNHILSFIKFRKIHSL